MFDARQAAGSKLVAASGVECTLAASRDVRRVVWRVPSRQAAENSSERGRCVEAVGTDQALEQEGEQGFEHRRVYICGEQGRSEFRSGVQGGV